MWRLDWIGLQLVIFQINLRYNRPTLSLISLIKRNEMNSLLKNLSNLLNEPERSN